jgi:predicted DNA-binding protein with PD1-like motif/Zn-finger nucleic acid-binding protein
MRLSEYEGAEIDVCRAFCGIWLDKGEFNLLGRKFIDNVNAGKEKVAGSGPQAQRVVHDAVRDAKMKDEAARLASSGSSLPPLPPMPPIPSSVSRPAVSGAARGSPAAEARRPPTHFESKLDKDFLVIRIDEGSDLFAGIEEACSKHYVRSGMIITGIGQARHLELGFLDEHGKYKRDAFQEIHEVLSLQGSVAQDEGKLHIHAHGVFSDREHRTKGGHVFKAEVRTLCEVTIISVYGLKRKTLPSGVKCTVFS